jgi:DNA end-binding protein Ku
MLELMHFPEELIDESEFHQPAKKTVGKAEMQMARQLISSMSSDWKPEEYTDEYHRALEKLIEEKIEHPDHALPKPAKKREATNVIDLVSVLQKSLQQTKGGSHAGTGKKRKAVKSRHVTRKKAA